MPVFRGPVCRHLHFPKLNNICHFSDHLTNLLMSSCNICLSRNSLVFLKSLVSSANFNILPVRPTVEPLSNDHPHQRPSLLYDHISCDGQCFLFVRTLTNDHPSDATSDRVRWNFPANIVDSERPNERG